MHPLTEFIRDGLRSRADPVRAGRMASYMKHKQPFRGVASPEVRLLFAEGWRRFQPRDYGAYEQVMRELWGNSSGDGGSGGGGSGEGGFREERYAAIRLGERARAFRLPQALELYEWMVVTGQWWDLVDVTASNLIGPLIRLHPRLRPRVFGYIDSDDMWLRRTALLSQLNLKEQTDVEALGAMILKTAHEREFFIRKAIGWVLRQYARTDPGFVRSFVARHGERLSPLSRKEALRNL